MRRFCRNDEGMLERFIKNKKVVDIWKKLVYPN